MSLVQIINLILIALLIAPEIKGNADVFEPSSSSSGGSGSDSSKQETEKRQGNFRIPVEMSFDPKFWPARGRRMDAYDLGGGQADVVDKVRFKSHHLLLDGCFYLAEAFPEFLIKNFAAQFLGCRTFPQPAERFAGRKQKRPKYVDVSDSIWLRGKFPPNLSSDLSSYQEKEKKQNIFWVTRG